MYISVSGKCGSTDQWITKCTMQKCAGITPVLAAFTCKAHALAFSSLENLTQQIHVCLFHFVHQLLCHVIPKHSEGGYTLPFLYCIEITEILVVSFYRCCVIHLPLVLSVHALEACSVTNSNTQYCVITCRLYVTENFLQQVYKKTYLTFVNQKSSAVRLIMSS